MGCGERDYRQNQAWQSQISGGFSAYTSVRGRPDDEQDVRGYLVLSGKALATRREALLDLLAETLTGARFDELKRLREIVSQMRSRRERSITGQGHAMAMLAACAAFAPAARLAHEQRGLEGVRRLKALDLELDEAGALEALSDRLQRLHQKMQSAPRRVLLVGEEEYRQSLSQALESPLERAAEGG